MSDRTAHVASLIDSWVEGGSLANAMVGTWHAEEQTLLHIACDADPASPKHIRRDSLFRIYSMTKPITACCFLLLMEEGKVC